MRSRMLVVAVLLLSAGSFLWVVPAFAQSFEQTEKLKVYVQPKQAYVFVDGKAIREGSQTIKVAAGNHEVQVFNYGYQPKTQNVHVETGKKANTMARPCC